jgi:hypothetical protein
MNENFIASLLERVVATISIGPAGLVNAVLTEARPDRMVSCIMSSQENAMPEISR